MTDSSYTHIVILADRTTSMGALTESGSTRAKDSTRGIRQLVTDQGALDGKVTFTLTEFNSWQVHEVAAFAAADDPELAKWTCVPAGSTPLIDACGVTIHRTGEGLAALDEDARPGTVIFVIATDGEENCSKEYTLDQVKQMVTTQQETYGWQFIFIGAGIDAFGEAGKFGVAAASTMSADAGSFAVAYAGTSSAISSTRSGLGPVSYTDAQRKAASGSLPA
jgi:hypothetical protein